MLNENVGAGKTKGFAIDHCPFTILASSNL